MLTQIIKTIMEVERQAPVETIYMAQSTIDEIGISAEVYYLERAGTGMVIRGIPVEPINSMPHGMVVVVGVFR